MSYEFGKTEKIRMNPTTFDIRPFTSIDEQQWNALWRQSRSRNIFYDHGYLSAILRTLPENYHFQQVVTLESKGQLVLVQPIVRQRIWMGEVLHFFSPFYGDHVEPVCAPEAREAYWNGLLDFLRRQSGVDLICGNGLSELFTGFLQAKELGLHPQLIRQHPVIELELPGSLEAFWGLYRSNFRSSLRRRIRVAEREGMQVRYVETGDAQQQSLKAVRDLHLKRWAGRLFGATDFSMPVVQRFHENLLEQPRGGIHPLFVEILDGDKVIASNYALLSPETMILYHHCFDPDYHSFGMGDLLAFYSIDYAIRKKLKRIDFKRGEEVYKTKWTNSKTENFDIVIPLTGKGKMIAQQKLWWGQLKDNRTLRKSLKWVKKIVDTR